MSLTRSSKKRDAKCQRSQRRGDGRSYREYASRANDYRGVGASLSEISEFETMLYDFGQVFSCFHFSLWSFDVQVSSSLFDRRHKQKRLATEPIPRRKPGRKPYLDFASVSEMKNVAAHHDAAQNSATAAVFKENLLQQKRRQSERNGGNSIACPPKPSSRTILRYRHRILPTRRRAQKKNPSRGRALREITNAITAAAAAMNMAGVPFELLTNLDCVSCTLGTRMNDKPFVFMTEGSAKKLGRRNLSPG